VDGARWVQKDLLTPNRDADLRVFVVWFRMYPGDAKSRWPRELLHDRRVVQRWDEPKNAGRWFFDHLSSLRPSRGGDGVFPQRVDALWDSYLLFDRSAAWTNMPTGVMSWGYTVIRTRDKLLEDFRFAVGGRATRSGRD
jgi:hypothetical protein